MHSLARTLLARICGAKVQKSYTNKLRDRINGKSISKGHRVQLLYIAVLLSWNHLSPHSTAITTVTAQYTIILTSFVRPCRL